MSEIIFGPAEPDKSIPTKCCKNCRSSDVWENKYTVCYEVPWLQLIFEGPNVVRPDGCCPKFGYNNQCKKLIKKINKEKAKMEMEDKCNCTSNRKCRNCDFAALDVTTRKYYCLNVSWLRMALLGPRYVGANASCKRHVFRELNRGQSR